MHSVGSITNMHVFTTAGNAQASQQSRVSVADDDDDVFTKSPVNSPPAPVSTSG